MGADGGIRGAYSLIALFRHYEKDEGGTERWWQRSVAVCRVIGGLRSLPPEPATFVSPCLMRWPA